MNKIEIAKAQVVKAIGALVDECVIVGGGFEFTAKGGDGAKLEAYGAYGRVKVILRTKTAKFKTRIPTSALIDVVSRHMYNESPASQNAVDALMEFPEALPLLQVFWDVGVQEKIIVDGDEYVPDMGILGFDIRKVG